MVEESSGSGRDSRGRFRRKKGDAESPKAEAEGVDAVAEDAAGTEDAGDEMEIIDISDTTAPSIGPHSTMKRPAPDAQVASSEERSDIDAMGLDKRRQVVGQSYGPSVARQASVYGIFLAVMAALVFGFLLLAKELDKAPASYEDKAPWAVQDAPQEPPALLE